MKKVTAIALSSALLLSLMGCGGAGTASDASVGSVSITGSRVASSSDTANATDGISIEKIKVTAGISEDLNGRPNDDAISYQGKTISVLDDVATTFATLGEPTPESSSTDESEAESRYCFKSWGISVSTYDLNGTESPLNILIQSPEIKTSRNIGIGNTKEEIFAAYGAPVESIDNEVVSALTYSFDGYDITFNFEGDQTTKVESIIYENMITHDQI